MAKCDICGKTLAHGNKISIARSHVSRRTTRTFKPNLRRVKLLLMVKLKQFMLVQNAYVLEKLLELN